MTCQLCNGTGKIVKEWSQQCGTYVTLCCACNPTHFVLFRQHVPNSPMVKEANFFAEQGGLSDEWGKNWKPYVATSIGDARRQCAAKHGVNLSHIYNGEV